MAGQVGWKTEAAWGTAVEVDTFVPVTNASLDVDQGYLRSNGIRAGRRTRDPGRLGGLTVAGTVDMELYNTSIAVLFKHLFGAVDTSGASAPYTHTFTPGPHVGKSLTLQVGIEDTGGTVRPFTAAGTKVGGWTLNCQVGELAMLSFDWTSKDVVTSEDLETASYAAGLMPFTFIEGAITVDGDPIASANAIALQAAKNLRTDRHVIGSRNIREQREQDHFEITSEITADFDNLDLVNLSLSGAQVASVLTFDNGTESLVITCSGQVLGDPPSLTNPGIEEQTIRLDHSSGTSDAATITAVLTNSEATAE